MKFEPDMPSSTPPEPSLDCPICPRLVAYRCVNAVAEPNWFNAPVPSFGDPHAQLLIVGLAPGVRGANRTGRPFTGDYAGDLLYSTLSAYGFSSGRYDARADDGLVLTNAMITNAVRCVPPENKPTTPEIHSCRPFLTSRITSLPRVKILLALGKIAHDSTVRAFEARLSAHPFGHASRHEFHHEGRKLALYDSYHCSRYNTNTGRLSEEMFHRVFADIRDELDQYDA